MKTRILSALVLAPCVVMLVFWGGWFFGAMVAIAAMIVLYEFTGLVDKIISGRFWHYIAGGLYFSAAFGAFVFLRFGFEQGAWLVMVMMVCVWASDSGAYFVGKTVGGAKLAPKLSPNKTWAGLGGSVFFCVLTLILLQSVEKILPLSGEGSTLSYFSLSCLIVTGGILGIVGQAGDLLISFYKRRANAKDSGSLIPGHGGLLDRIDSLLLVSPVFLGILILCQ